MGLVMLVFVSSCTIERKLGQRFVNDPPPICIQLFFPEGLLKFPHIGESVPGLDSLSDDAQDSALFVNSRFLQFVDDSIYLEKYINTFIDELRSLKFKVFVEQSIDTFLRNHPQSYLLNMTQIQLDEYFYPLEDSEVFGDSTFYKEFDLNAVDASSWFELSKINTPKPVKTVLYSSFSTTDGFEGRFILNGFASDVMYKYKIDTLAVRDIYDLAVFSGRKHAGFLYDYFLNQYISLNMPQGIEKQYHLHYNRTGNYLEYTEDERFEVVSSK